MKKTRFKETQIVSILKQQEGGRTTKELAREHSTTELPLLIISMSSPTVGNTNVSGSFTFLYIFQCNRPVSILILYLYFLLFHI